MKGVSGHAVAHNLGVDARAPVPGKFQLLKNHDPCSLTNHKAVAITFKRPGGMLWIVIARGQSPHRGKTGNTHWRDGRFRTATNHYIGIAALNYFEAVTDGMCSRGTCGRRSGIWSLGAKPDRNLTGCQVDDC